jgi:site-specific recombinase XerD
LTAVHPTAALESLIQATLATCPSAETRRVYRWQLEKFLGTGLPLNGAGIAAHLQQLRNSGMCAATLAQATAAIRKLALQALQCGLITPADFSQLQGVGPGKFRNRSGMCLTIEQVLRLRWLPDPESYWGKRDACILSLMLGCGLKRAEMANLKWTAYRLWGGRMWLVDVGQGNKRRTIPVPLWAQEDADAWYFASRDEPPKPVYSLRHMERTRPRNHEYIAGGMRGDAVHALVQRYGKELGRSLTPDDLRLSLARLLRKSGAPLEQIQSTLGHVSIATTEAYLKSAR